MHHDGSESSNGRLKFRSPLASRKYGYSCKHPYSASKYGKTIHLVMKDNPRLINFTSVTLRNGKKNSMPGH